MFPGPSFSTTALAIVVYILIGSAIVGVVVYFIGFWMGYSCAAARYEQAAHALRLRIKDRTEEILWRDFPEDQEETRFEQLMKAHSK